MSPAAIFITIYIIGFILIMVGVHGWGFAENAEDWTFIYFVAMWWPAIVFLSPFFLLCCLIGWLFQNYYPKPGWIKELLKNENSSNRTSSE